MSSSNVSVWFGATILVIACSLDAHAQQDVTAVVTPSGEIVYYSMSGQIPPIPDQRRMAEPPPELEAALARNAGMKDFFANNPDLYVTTGLGDPLYTWNPNTGDVEAASAAADPGIMKSGWWGEQLDTDTFLRNLARNLFDQTKEMACQISVHPTTVEGTVSVGIVSFSANWDLGQLCTP
jgi:hypothetical protein